MPKLPTDAKERKGLPIVTGVWDYFPDCWGEIAKASLSGNSQHVPGTPLHWDRTKSKDDVDAAGRHLLERGTLDTDGIRHTAKAAWRILAVLQKEIEEERKRSDEPKTVKWVNVFLAQPSISDPTCVRYGYGTLYDDKETAFANVLPQPGYMGTFPIEIKR